MCCAEPGFGEGHGTYGWACPLRPSVSFQPRLRLNFSSTLTCHLNSVTWHIERRE